MSGVFEIIWGSVRNYQEGYSGSTYQVIYDINGDGREDVLAFGAVYPGSGPGTAPFRIYLQDADGSFTADNPMADGSDLLTTHPRNVTFADFNGDGISDIFIAAHGYDVDPFPGEQNRLLLGTGNAKFTDASSSLPSIDDFSHGAAAADIDRDGDLDIYVANTYGQNVEPPYFLVNDGQGNFSRDSGKVPASVYNGIPNDEKFMVADFSDLDGDGFQDLILGGERINNRIYWGSATGGFSDSNFTTLPAAASVINQYHGFIEFDFNGDGRLDLLAQGIQELSQPGRIQILINDGGRGYTDQTSAYITGTPEARTGIFELRLLDINNDGALDILRSGDVLTNADFQDVLFWLNDGSNHFSSYTLAQAGFDGELIQAAYLAANGEIRWLSSLGTSTDGGFANYYLAEEGLHDLLPKAAVDSMFESASDDETFDGGPGLDTVVFSGARDSYALSSPGGMHWVVEDIRPGSPNGTDTVIDVERLDFTDGTLAFDTVGTAGQAYRLYQAAFDRTPDVDGLGYWIRELDEGKGDLAWMANNFIISEEFKSTYGSPETVSDQQFLNLLYQNVLNRDADGDGFTYWMNELESGFARERVLASFSESIENQENVAGAIQDGIWYA